MKKFIIKITLYMMPMVLVTIYVWFFGYDSWTGDLGRLGKIPFGEYDTIFTKPDFNYIQNVQNLDTLSQINILTIGDSFSQQGIYGYQNYLGKIIHSKVYNFLNTGDLSPERVAFQIIKDNLLPVGSTLIVESVERLCIYRLETLSNLQDIKLNAAHQSSNVSNKPSFITLNEIFSFIRLSCGYDLPYSKVKLTAELFTHNDYANTLFFLNSKKDSDLAFKDIDNNTYTNSVQNLILLHQYAEAHGVKLIYLICADKYDMYSKFIDCNQFPTNNTLSYFDDAECPWIINSKAILDCHLSIGEKDIYKCNDTHWSPKAAKYIAEELAKRIILLP